MSGAKAVRIAPISAADAAAVVRRLHYSGTVVRNSQLHLGAFLDGRLEGAMQFGPPMDKSKVLPLVRGTPWNGMLELNRMAFSERLPRNSESRALSVALRMIRRSYPHIRWVISFADGAQCGDGTIYRAAGFVLTQIKPNNQVWQMPDGRKLSRITMTKGTHILSGSGGASLKGLQAQGARKLEGFQLRYIYFLDPAARADLTVPVLDFAAIDRAGARMARGQRKGAA